MRKIKKLHKIISIALSLGIVLSSMPILVTSAEGDEPDPTTKPTVSELLGDGYMKSEDFDREAINAYADNIVNGTAGITDIGKLPSYEEFVTATNYSNTVFTLTSFREQYGTGSSFAAPTHDVIIYLTNSNELDLLSLLVNNRADDETSVEQQYYSTTTYVLSSDIKYTGQRFVPIGNTTYPFNGVLDGNGCEILSLTLSEDVNTTYADVSLFGLFGYLGTSGKVKNLGLVDASINLPYTVGADVSILCGQNHGTIEDCYVNTSSATASNATVGGLVSENYGTIQRTYADVDLSVDITSGSYSDPGQIAAVNDGTILYSYYLNNRTSTYGTSATLFEFRDGLEGTNFHGCQLHAETHTEQPTLYTISQFVGLVGTGANFDLNKAQTLLADEHSYLVVGQDDENRWDRGNECRKQWNLFASLVNHTAPGETDVEQNFYSHANVYMGYSWYSYGYGNTSKDYSTYQLTINNSEIPLIPVGTSEYPFCGTFDGDNAVFSYVFSNINWVDDGYEDVTISEMPSLFGVIGEGGCVRNINFSFNNSYWEHRYYHVIYQPNKSAIFFKENNGLVENCHVYSPNYFEYGRSVTNEWDFSSYIYTIGLINNGTVKHCDSYTNYVSFCTWNPLNAIEINNGTLNNVAIYYSRQAPYNNIGDFVVCDSYDEYYSDQIHIKNQNDYVGEDYEVTDYSIEVWPSVLLLQPDANNKYHIKTPADFMYFVKHGTGESVVLDNTIDMSYTKISQIYSGSFNLDGTLIDNNDVCSYIDLGTGTKCYGILNLSFEVPSLSQGQINMDNVYFIGGLYNVDNWEMSYDDICDTDYLGSTDYWSTSAIHFIPIYGQNINNVHSSMDIKMNRLTNTSSRMQMAVTMSKSAKNSSFAGIVTFIEGTYNAEDMVCCVSMNADHCASYAKIINSARSGNFKVNVIGYNVKNSPVYDFISTMECPSNYIGVIQYISVGQYVENCKASGQYILNTRPTREIFLFGYSKSKNCVFDGLLDSKNYSNTSIYLAKNADGVIFDTNGVAANKYLGCLEGKNVVFRGTINTNNACLVRGCGERISNCYNMGTINIKQNNTKAYIHGVGTGITQGVMAGNINFEKDGNSWTNSGFSNIYYFGNGYGMNLTNVEISNTPITDIGIFYNTYASTDYEEDKSKMCCNYGLININNPDYTYTVYIGNGVNHCINFANVNLVAKSVNFYGLYISSLDYSLQRMQDSKNINFGNINIVADNLSDSILKNEIYPVRMDNTSTDNKLYSCYSTLVKDNYNMGDITISSNTEEVSLSSFIVYGCYGGKNYGNITFDGVQTSSYSENNLKHEIYGSNFSNYANITVKNTLGYQLSVTGVKFSPNYDYSTSSNLEDTIDAYGNINLRGNEYDGTIDCCVVSASDFSSGTTTINNSMPIHMELNDFFTSVNVYGIYSNGSRITNIVSKNNDITILNNSFGSTRIYGELYSTSDVKTFDFSQQNISMESSRFTALSVCGVGYVPYVQNKFIEGKANISLKNSTVAYNLVIYGIAEELQSAAVNNGSITIENVKRQTQSHANSTSDTIICGICKKTKNLDTYYNYYKDRKTNMLNNADIHYEIDDGYQGKSYISGCCYEVGLSNTLCMNAGNIETYGCGDLYVQGVAYTISTANQLDNCMFVNAGNISVHDGNETSDTPKALDCCGIANNADTIINAINTGDITIDSANLQFFPKHVCGIAYSVKDMQSVVNWGDIVVNDLYNNNNVYAIGRTSTSLCAWLNYGNVTANVCPDVTDTSNLYVMAVDFDGTVDDSQIIAGTGINYGSFNYAHASSFGGASTWFVDLSGNKNTIPSAYFNYSTDTTAHNRAALSNLDFLFEKQYWLSNKGYVGDNVPSSSWYDLRNFSYEYMLNPFFGFIAKNPLAYKYKTAVLKDERNGENIIDYADMSELRGQTANYLTENYPTMRGGFCLNGSGLKEGEIAGCLDCDIEERISHEIFDDYTIDTKWGTKTVKDFFEQDLNQRDVGTAAKIHHDIKIESVDKYTTVTGNEASLTNKSSLILYQAAPYGYTTDLFVTVAPLYIQTNEFTDVEGQNVAFKMKQLVGSDNIKFRYFTEPIVYTDEDDMISKVRQQFKNCAPDYKCLDISYRDDADASFSMVIPENGQTSYAMVGLAISEDGQRTNALIIELNSVSSQPKGWITNFYYATDAKFTGYSYETGYKYDSMFDTNKEYTEGNIYTNTDKYTVTKETMVTETYGEIEYPVYTMSENIFKTSDGVYDSSSSYNDYRSYKFSSLPSINTSFSLKNADQYLIYVKDGKTDTWFKIGDMPNDSAQASENGVETVKTIKSLDLLSLTRLKEGTVDTAISSSPSCNSYLHYLYRSANVSSYLGRYYNPFAYGGEKEIIIGTKAASGEFIPLSKIIVQKDFSDENYIRYDSTYGAWGRHDVSTTNGSSTKSESAKISKTYMKTKDVFTESFVKNANVSFAATKENLVTRQYTDFVNSGKTYYPTKRIDSFDVVAENGDVQTYQHIYTFRSMTEIPTYSLQNKNKNKVLTYNTDQVYVFDKEQELGFYLNYSTSYVNFYDTNDSFINIYVDGELVESNVRSSWQGLQFMWSTDGKLGVSLKSGATKQDVPDGVITLEIVYVISPQDANNEAFTIAVQPFSFTKTLSTEHRVTSVSWNNTLVTSAISTSETELSNNVDIYGDGTIDYTLTPDDANVFYITNSVEPTCTSDQISIKIPAFAQLQTYDGTNWNTVFTADGTNLTYKKNVTYTAEELGAGYHFNFRVIAQGYDESDIETQNLVSYYNTTITAVTRNKSISIEFDTGTETLNCYNEILNNYGNTSIQIKNMNGEFAKLQQTKIYQGNSADSMKSTFYKLAQGDYAIDVQVPKEYIASVKIVGGSSEGFLQPNPVVKGDRVQLPYANAQNIRLVVYLTKRNTKTSWGVSYFETLTKKIRHNNI